MKLKLIAAAAAALLWTAPQALAQPRVSIEISAPYIPEGLLLRKTEDCSIQSSGGPPDAHLRCAPGLGWRLQDAATGDVLYPKSGYISSDLEWAFAGPQAVALLEGRDLKIVRLPSGESEYLGRGDLHQLRDVEGLGFSAVVWKPGADEAAGEAFIVLADGALSGPLAGADMRPADYTRGLGCRQAVVLAALGAENLPNSTWSRIVRRSAATDNDLCQTIHADRLAGLGADGRWRPLGPASFKAVGADTYTTAEEALGE